MLVTAYLAFVLLAALCVGLELAARRALPPQPAPTAVANPAFRGFQTLFLRGYLLALWADWLQGPYLYKLYRHYSFLESQIAILYVCGLASCVLFSPVATWLPQAIGRRNACLLFCLAYSACCLTKLSRDYFILILGRVLGGLSTSLLSTVFEAWYVHRHLDVRDFPREWIPSTFTRAAGWNHGLAVAAGLVANLLAEWAGLGPVAPFVLAIPCLGACGWVVLWDWGKEEAEGGLLGGEKGGPLLTSPGTAPAVAPASRVSAGSGSGAPAWRACGACCQTGASCSWAESRPSSRASSTSLYSSGRQSWTPTARHSA
ncbi:hypothetical protein AGOR_G00131630 [Albula goreensis]|uniref:Molybdate-anion transporter n=1 Tax=Albula goreensis TaxID=1534307 RepID=A0A8T3D6E4_9TELE|nr:hypothetical protein AGOR_G00131630 [Albula goreensis]